MLAQADAVFVGGGNTFRLLDRLYSSGMFVALREAVAAGMPYLGTSAGSNVAGPTIKTTNDMPIVQPPTFDAFGFVNFQINTHYVDRDPDSSHRGETREERLFEYLEENDSPVVALREGAMLRVDGTSVLLDGTARARLYWPGTRVNEYPPGTRLDSLIEI